MTIPDEEAVKLLPDALAAALRAFAPDLFGDDPESSHMAASPLHIKAAKAPEIIRVSRAILAYLSALSPTTPDTQAPGSGETVPAGWRLVPVEPTEAMVEAFYGNVVMTREGSAVGFNLGYRAMLASAPSASIGAIAWQVSILPDEDGERLFGVTLPDGGVWKVHALDEADALNDAKINWPVNNQEASK